MVEAVDHPRLPQLVLPTVGRVRFTQAGLAAALLAVAAWRLFALWQVQGPVDWELYRDAALRWEAGGSFYAQLTTSPILYPPIALWLIVPFAHLPAILWWATPIGLFAWALRVLRPTGWAWPAIALCLATAQVQGILTTGRPTMWVGAFFALAMVHGGWAALVLLKPSLFPFMLVGVKRRSWWITLAVVLVLSLPFTTMWLDWVAAVQSSRSDLLYSLQDLPLLAIPICAWLSRHPATAPNVGA